MNGFRTCLKSNPPKRPLLKMTSIHNASVAFTSFGSKKLFSSYTATCALISAPPSIGLTALLSDLVADTPVKDLVLPILVAFVTLTLYWLIYAVDLFFGIKASRKQGKEAGDPDWFKSGKGWSSLIKIFIITVSVTWLAVFSILSAIGNFPILPTGFMLMSGTVGIIGTIMDIHSIGENQKRLTGKKHAIFTWFEKLGTAVQEGIILKISNFFSK